MHFLLKFIPSDWVAFGKRQYPNRGQSYYIFHDVDTRRMWIESLNPNPFLSPILVSIVSKKTTKEYTDDRPLPQSQYLLKRRLSPRKINEKIIHSFIFREIDNPRLDALIYPAKLYVESHRGVIAFPKFDLNYLWTGAIYIKDAEDGKMLAVSIVQSDSPIPVHLSQFCPSIHTALKDG